jgi:hypothetical protein
VFEIPEFFLVDSVFGIAVASIVTEVGGHCDDDIRRPDAHRFLQRFNDSYRVPDKDITVITALPDISYWSSKGPFFGSSAITITPLGVLELHSKQYPGR